MKIYPHKTEKTHNVKWVDTDKVRFSIERHPHLFGHQSKGMASSAFARQVHNFELDVNTKQVKELGKEIQGYEINYGLLAEEVVPDTFEGWLRSEQMEELVKLKREKEVINFAKQGFKEIDWLAPYDSEIEEYNISDSDVNEILTAFEDAFINKVLEEWKYLKTKIKNKGILTKTGADTLHEHRYLGNEAVHELTKPYNTNVSYSDLKTKCHIV